MRKEVSARRLAKAMSDVDIKAIDLSRKTGISRGSISQYLSGRNSPSNTNAAKIAGVLSVNPVWLMGFDVEEHDPLYTDEELTLKEKELLETYRSIDHGSQRLLLLYLDALKEKA